LLKKALGRYLPETIINRGKEGFSIPIKNWLREDLKELLLDVLEPSRVRNEGFFNVDFVERLKKEHLDGKENHSHRLWAMMVFGIWQETYLKHGAERHITGIPEVMAA
jgi:asparagine synthase (glutamine-hydrolysing)